MRHFVSPWRVALAEALCAGKVSLHTEEVSLPVRTSAIPSVMEAVQCNPPATR